MMMICRMGARRCSRGLALVHCFFSEMHDGGCGRLVKALSVQGIGRVQKPNRGRGVGDDGALLASLLFFALDHALLCTQASAA